MAFDLGGVLTTGKSEALLAVLADHGVDDPQSREEALARWRPLHIRASLGRMHPDEQWRELRGVADLERYCQGKRMSNCYPTSTCQKRAFRTRWPG